MAEPKVKSLEELQKLKLQSEIAKNTAEAERAVKETKLFQKQFEERWYSKKNLKRMATGAITAFALWGIVQVIINPVINLQEDKREWEIKATEAENQFYAAEFKNIKKERDVLESQKLALAQEKTFLRKELVAKERSYLARVNDFQKTVKNLGKRLDLTEQEKEKFKQMAQQLEKERVFQESVIKSLTAEIAKEERKNRLRKPIESDFGPASKPTGPKKGY